jgi:hypothetical protein
LKATLINLLSVYPQIFQPKDAPDYIPGKVAIMVLLSIQLVISLLLRSINIRLNKKKRSALLAEKETRGWTDSDLQRERERHAFRDLTDKQYVPLGVGPDRRAEKYATGISFSYTHLKALLIRNRMTH